MSLEKVGIHDNFLELGGHSLAATQVLSRVINAFMVEVPLKSLFDAPTVEKMAAVINEHQHRKLGEQDLNRILGELESMSDEDAQRLLARESTPRT